MDNDKELLSCLFHLKCFEEISILIHNHRNEDWPFKKEQFKMVIEQEELDLILFFLRRRECRVVLEEHHIQKRIVNTYLKYSLLLKI